jgi:DNA-binding CsgD family transcriptional regulator
MPPIVAAPLRARIVEPTTIFSATGGSGATGGVRSQAAMPALLDRDVEMRELSRRLAAVRAGAGRVIVVEGPAGIGKSTLLEAAAAVARSDGATVLRARCSPLEQQAPWGSAQQLLEPLRRRADWDDLLVGAAALAERALAPGPVEPAPPGEAMHAAVRGLVWLASNLSERGPALLVVDDIHWADAPTLRWLAVLSRSLDELPLGVLCAVRAGEPPGAPDLLAELLAAAPEPSVRPRALGPAATETLVRERLPAAGPSFAHACHAVTGGNPFLLRSLVAELAAAGVEPGDEAAAQLSSFGPEQVARGLDRQLARLPEGAGPLARAVAVLGPGAPLRHAAPLAELDPEAAARAADALRAAGLIVGDERGRHELTADDERGRDDRGGLSLAHPLIAGVLYDGLAPGQRTVLHARAAELLAAERADAERVALHLLRTEPHASASTVATLREAAARAGARGAPQSAAAYLRRALAEPPAGAAEEADLRLELGLALAAHLQPDAYDLLQEAVAAATTGQRGAIALRAARALGLIGRFDPAVALCRQGLEGAPDGVRERLEAELVTVSWTHLATIGEARRRSRAGGPPGLFQIAAATDGLTAGRPARETLAQLRPALRTLADEPDSLVGTVAAIHLIADDELDDGIALCDALIDTARPRGWLIALAHGSMLRAMALVRAGEVSDAEADARLAFEYKLPVAPPAAMLWALTFLVDALVELDDLEGAETALAAAGQLGAPPEGALPAPMLLQGRARLRLAQHRPAEALADARLAGERARELELWHPVLATWRIEAAEALGDGPEARRLVREQLELAERLGTAGARGAALRAVGRTHRDVAALERAVDVLDGSPIRLEHARALVDLGAALRRANRRADAREPLRRALDLCRDGGMRLLARRARHELHAAGARPRRSALSGRDALTPAEHRVATLAAQGLNNRAIAERLYVTRRTVETHLTHAFQKLDIATRADLPAALRGEEPAMSAR